MAFAIIFSATTSSSSIVSAFHYSAISPLSAANSNAAVTSHTSSLSTQLDAAANNFSELDQLRAKRLSLRRPSPPSPSDAAAIISDNNDDHASAGDQQQQQQGLEYLYDQRQERHDDDFFHVILMPSTFTKKQVSIEQSTTSLLTALSTTTAGANNNQLTYEKAHNLSLFAKHQGFSVIGTWTREDCLLIGETLLEEGLDCRVIPYNSALPSLAVPSSSSSSSVVVVGEQTREESDLESKSVVAVGTTSSLSSSSSSFSSDYLLSLSP
eukprot:CAMPEP_0113413772 /NCGR_PEP_ID=MMETSP0013_2-20120614/23634_1 /TAXON_ID=2843 ORGANISM="Skeletonema costatum, Strain 1716" /NCGR_SAMPLE_ID=MMETSP0013_2 /ASSEMBLY_ACC=CAM_ASM_000158 /LENGTH=267 /DNA_ID=CAMNT_0000300529 /DNA_START=82 /DNA_END=885 /DNA_ORIENTATION=- /assembly_acc=CAM_ASM_000158